MLQRTRSAGGLWGFVLRDERDELVTSVEEHRLPDGRMELLWAPGPVCDRMSVTTVFELTSGLEELLVHMRQLEAPFLDGEG